MPEIYYVRHGETDANAQGLIIASLGGLFFFHRDVVGLNIRTQNAKRREPCGPHLSEPTGAVLARTASVRIPTPSLTRVRRAPLRVCTSPSAPPT